MASAEERKSAAEAVKAEANVLFQGRKLKEAYAKYSEAIALDGTNAILFANRAACSLELQQYLNAACDARKATKLDPKYVKAWARLGKATMELKAYNRSMEAWESALACLPKDKLSDAEKQVKATCEVGLRQAKSELKEEPQRPPNERMIATTKSVMDKGLLPWQVAQRMEHKMHKIGPSSAWVILTAYREFTGGCAKMFKTVVVNGMISGPLGAVADISNALLRDHRAFAITTPDWINIYNRQITMEMFSLGASGWADGGAAEVQEKALALQKEKGFEDSRNALSITIRAWFMRAFIEEKFTGDPKPAVELYRNILSVLEWGLKTWEGVPNTERGAIFNETFVRGMRRHYLNVYLAACRRFDFRPIGGLDCLDCEELDRLAEQQIKETQENMPRGDEEYLKDKGFYSSFFVYPVAEALAVRGAIAMDKGIKCKVSDPERAKEYFEQGKKHYLIASELLPKDEEYRLLYVKVAFEACWYRGDPIRDCLGCAYMIAENKAAVSKLWSYSSLKQNLDAQLAQVEKFQEVAYVGMIEENFSEDSPVAVVDFRL